MARRKCGLQVLHRRGVKVQPHLRQGNDSSLGCGEVLVLHPWPPQLNRPLIKIFSSITELGDVLNPCLYNWKIWLLPYRFTPVFVPGMKYVKPDYWSRHRDFQANAQPPAPTDLLDIRNVDAFYSSTLGPPSWVSKPRAVLAFLTSNPMDFPSPNREEASGQAEEQLVR